MRSSPCRAGQPTPQIRRAGTLPCGRQVRGSPSWYRVRPRASCTSSAKHIKETAQLASSVEQPRIRARSVQLKIKPTPNHTPHPARRWAAHRVPALRIRLPRCPVSTTFRAKARQLPSWSLGRGVIILDNENCLFADCARDIGCGVGRDAQNVRRLLCGESGFRCLRLEVVGWGRCGQGCRTDGKNDNQSAAKHESPAKPKIK